MALAMQIHQSIISIFTYDFLMAEEKQIKVYI